MDFKKPENILEFIKFQRIIFYKFHRYIKNKMESNYKKSALFVYWLNDYIEYIKNEDNFNPSLNMTYKRGQIIFVNFGYRVGAEIGGRHYAIVLDTKNSRRNKTITVLPLNSKKDKDTAHSRIYHVSIGSIVKDLLFNKATDIINKNFLEVASLAEILTSKKSISKETSQGLCKKMETLKHNRRIADSIIDYTDSLTDESVADVGQIVTVSKQRIVHPCKKDDVLAGVILPDDIMQNIDKRIKTYYIGLYQSE